MSSWAVAFMDVAKRTARYKHAGVSSRPFIVGFPDRGSSARDNPVYHDETARQVVLRVEVIRFGCFQETKQVHNCVEDESCFGRSH
jgi:hypothetical protein